MSANQAASSYWDRLDWPAAGLRTNLSNVEAAPDVDSVYRRHA